MGEKGKKNIYPPPPPLSFFPPPKSRTQPHNDFPQFIFPLCRLLQKEVRGEESLEVMASFFLLITSSSFRSSLWLPYILETKVSSKIRDFNERKLKKIQKPASAQIQFNKCMPFSIAIVHIFFPGKKCDPDLSDIFKT